MPKATETDAMIAKDLLEARFDALRNGRYHADRESFLEGCHRWIMFLLILIGSASLSDLLFALPAVIPAVLRPILSLLVAILASLDLVFQLSPRAKEHNWLRQKYFEIAAQLMDGSISANVANARMLRLAAEEEAPFYAVYEIADDWAHQIVFAKKRADSQHMPRLYQRWTRHLFRHESIHV